MDHRFRASVRDQYLSPQRHEDTKFYREILHPVSYLLRAFVPSWPYYFNPGGEFFSTSQILSHKDTKAQSFTGKFSILFHTFFVPLCLRGLFISIREERSSARARILSHKGTKAQSFTREHFPSCFIPSSCLCVFVAFLFQPGRSVLS